LFFSKTLINCNTAVVECARVYLLAVDIFYWTLQTGPFEGRV